MKIFSTQKSHPIEQTLVMIKPHPELYTGENQDFFEHLIVEKGQQVDCILRAKNTKIFTENEVYIHYAHLRPMWFFPKIVDFITSGECQLLLMEGENAIKKMTTVKTEIRKQFGCHPGAFDWLHNDKPYKNILHASDSKKEASIEVERYFGNSVRNTLEHKHF